MKREVRMAKLLSHSAYTSTMADDKDLDLLPAPDNTAPELESEQIINNSRFDDAQFRQFYQPVAGFEGLHRVDHDATWTAAEEKGIIRKIDFRVLPFACLLFMAMQLDRSNISEFPSSRRR